MQDYRVYGLKEIYDLDLARRYIEENTRIKFVEHESAYHGGKYYLFITTKCGKIKLLDNFDEIDQEWLYADHQECRVY